jgi:cytochrome P450
MAEQARGRLSGDEVLATLVALVVAGVDTTVGLVCNAIAELLTWRRADPLVLDGRLSDQLFNELLRLSSPIHVVGRRAVAGAELDGRSLPEGSHVVLLLGAANRDPRVYADPDRIVPDRRGPVSLAFGAGAHYCVGAALARIQLSAVLPQLLAAFPGLELLEPPTVGPHANPSHYSEVPVSLAET